jgi:hypothetical protein
MACISAVWDALWVMCMCVTWWTVHHHTTSPPPPPTPHSPPPPPPGGSFTGDAVNPTVVNSTEPYFLYFRGRAILDATLAQLESTYGFLSTGVCGLLPRTQQSEYVQYWTYTERSVTGYQYFEQVQPSLLLHWGSPCASSVPVLPSPCFPATYFFFFLPPNDMLLSIAAPQPQRLSCRAPARVA